MDSLAVISVEDSPIAKGLKIEDLKVVTLDCPHSTTTAYWVQPPSAAMQVTLEQVKVVLCKRALMQTPCACIERFLVGLHDEGN